MRSLFLFLFAAALTAGCMLSAGTLRFRSGEILRAELSSLQPGIREFTPAHRADLPANPAWAILTVTLDPGRKISIHDYSIRYMGTNFPAVALTVDNAPFDVRKWEVPARPGLRCHLLFALDESVLAEKDSPRPLILISNSTVPSEQKVPFTVLGGKPFTKAEEVPGTGLFPEAK